MSESAVIRVGDVMTPSIKTIGRMATIAEAIEAMREAGVSSLVVERRDKKDEYGLVAITDIAREVIAVERRTWRDMCVEACQANAEQ